RPMPLRKISLLLLLSSSLCSASAVPQLEHASSIQVREKQIWTATKRDAEFAAVSHTNRGACRASAPPEALATPTPLLDQATPDVKVKVSFIIGTDGRVHSPLILESAGSSEDRVVIETVSSWRYRPATCNGVPTESEAKVGFSTH